MTGDIDEPRYRAANLADSDAIADLHAESWRLHYRGSFSDAFLDGPVVAERRRVWKARLRAPAPGQTVILAEQAGLLRGFACSFAGHDRAFGSLIDNLHVAAPSMGRGLGRGLMREVAGRLACSAPHAAVYLYVLDANHAARAFYDRLGGRPLEQSRSEEPDGSLCVVTRYAWASPARLHGLAAASCGSGLAGRRPRMQQPDQG